MRPSVRTPSTSMSRTLTREARAPTSWVRPGAGAIGSQPRLQEDLDVQKAYRPAPPVHDHQLVNPIFAEDAQRLGGEAIVADGLGAAGHHVPHPLMGQVRRRVEMAPQV